DIRVRAGPVVFSALNQAALADLAVTIRGGSAQQRIKAAEAVRERLRKMAGTNDGTVWQRSGAPTLRIDVDRAKAAALGLSTAEVFRPVIMVTSPAVYHQSFTDRVSGNCYFVEIRFREDRFRSAEDLLQIPLSGSGKVPVLLRDVARLE